VSLPAFPATDSKPQQQPNSAGPPGSNPRGPGLFSPLVLGAMGLLAVGGGAAVLFGLSGNPSRAEEGPASERQPGEPASVEEASPVPAGDGIESPPAPQPPPAAAAQPAADQAQARQDPPKEWPPARAFTGPNRLYPPTFHHPGARSIV